MSAGNPEKFPWGLNDPTAKQRIAVAIVVGVIAATALLLRFVFRPSDAVDFDLVWFGGRMLWEGRDPYPLVGPGRFFEWGFPLLYPAPALVAVMPLALLSKRVAAIVFVFIGSSSLCFGSTRDGWHRLPLFLSAPFLDTALGAQWSSILMAALFIPFLAFFACAKPQIGLAVIAGAASRRTIAAAAGGAVILVALSFALLPSWLGEWLAVLRTADHMKAALLQPGGFLILAVLARWRRPEAWIILATAALPQTLSWYSFLILLAFPASYREAQVLSMTSSFGFIAAHFYAHGRPADLATGDIVWAIVVFTSFLPPSIAVLRRPNVAQLPVWLGALTPRNQISPQRSIASE